MAGVLQALFDAGGRVIDSSPMYGKAEAAVGRLLAESGQRARAFVATKVWTSGRAAGIRQMEDSLRLCAPSRWTSCRSTTRWKTARPVSACCAG